MTYDPSKARVLQQLLQQGLSDEAALRQAGISARDADSYTVNEVGTPETNPFFGQVEPANYRSVQEVEPTPGPSIQPAPTRTTTPVSQQVTTTSQTTVTGGGVKTTRVTPTTYSDTPESRALSGEAESLQAQKEARSAELRAQGLTGADVLRDSQYRQLSNQQQLAQNRAQAARTVDQAGTVSVTTEPGAGTEFARTPNSVFLTDDTTGLDPDANLQEINEGPVDFGEPETIGAGISPYGEEDDPFDPDAAAILDEPDDGISPYGEEDDPFDPDFVPESEIRGDPDAVTDTGGVPTDTLADITAGGDTGLTPDQVAAQQAAQQQATLERARQQAILQQQRKQANDGDWRVKLRLAPGATYLYRAPNPGILQPLAITDGVVFPYTPSIQTAYKANYSDYQLTHSNYRGFFYQGSQVEDINITAKFTAQDSNEAQYLLAVIHFFRSVTKMFYGQDAERGAPPPLVYLQGLGEYQFNLAPCVIAQFNYNLPDNVDYIRAGSPNINGTSLLQRRSRQDLPTDPFSSAWSRIKNVLGAQGINKGAVPAAPAPPTLGTNRPTYVPTAMDITLVLHPIQSRKQVSQQFSVRQYANGDLLKGGFW